MPDNGGVKFDAIVCVLKAHGVDITSQSFDGKTEEHTTMIKGRNS